VPEVAGGRLVELTETLEHTIQVALGNPRTLFPYRNLKVVPGCDEARVRVSISCLQLIFWLEAKPWSLCELRRDTPLHLKHVG
jgi:hypothetical protein